MTGLPMTSEKLWFSRTTRTTWSAVGSPAGVGVGDGAGLGPGDGAGLGAGDAPGDGGGAEAFVVRLPLLQPVIAIAMSTAQKSILERNRNS